MFSCQFRAKKITTKMGSIKLNIKDCPNILRAFVLFLIFLFYKVSVFLWWKLNIFHCQAYKLTLFGWFEPSHWSNSTKRPLHYVLFSSLIWLLNFFFRCFCILFCLKILKNEVSCLDLSNDSIKKKSEANLLTESRLNIKTYGRKHGLMIVFLVIALVYICDPISNVQIEK